MAILLRLIISTARVIFLSSYAFIPHISHSRFRAVRVILVPYFMHMLSFCVCVCDCMCESRIRCSYAQIDVDLYCLSVYVCWWLWLWNGGGNLQVIYFGEANEYVSIANDGKSFFTYILLFACVHWDSLLSWTNHLIIKRYNGTCSVELWVQLFKKQKKQTQRESARTNEKNDVKKAQKKREKIFRHSRTTLAKTITWKLKIELIFFVETACFCSMQRTNVCSFYC